MKNKNKGINPILAIIIVCAVAVTGLFLICYIIDFFREYNTIIRLAILLGSLIIFIIAFAWIGFTLRNNLGEF